MATFAARAVGCVGVGGLTGVVRAVDDEAQNVLRSTRSRGNESLYIDVADAEFERAAFVAVLGD